MSGGSCIAIHTPTPVSGGSCLGSSCVPGGSCIAIHTPTPVSGGSCLGSSCVSRGSCIAIHIYTYTHTCVQRILPGILLCVRRVLHSYTYTCVRRILHSYTYTCVRRVLHSYTYTCVWKLPNESTKFKSKFDKIQGQLEELCGRDDLLTGVLSKSKGQIKGANSEVVCGVQCSL